MLHQAAQGGYSAPTSSPVPSWKPRTATGLVASTLRLKNSRLLGIEGRSVLGNDEISKHGPDLSSLDYRVWMYINGVDHSGGEINGLAELRHLILIVRQNLPIVFVQKAVVTLRHSVQCTLGFGGRNTQS